MDRSSQPNKEKSKKSMYKLFSSSRNLNRVGFLVEDKKEDVEQGNHVQSARLELCCALTDTPRSPTSVSPRPLSLEASQRESDQFEGNMRRCSSVSGDQFFQDDCENKNSLMRSASHGSIAVDNAPSSMDSLARRSLLAAQVLHLIPTTKARQRNFLQGRVAADSLLGSAELEKTFPNRRVTVLVGTWNMNGQIPPRELNDFVLPSGLEHVPDVLAVGTQESCPERLEWEISLQETIGPSHVLFHSVSLGTLHMAVFLRRDLIWYCSIPEDGSLSVRPGVAFRTKGAVAVAFMLFGTSFLFVTSHLTAHQEKVKERVSDIKKITHSLDLPKLLPLKHRNKDVTQNFDCVFWCGDLNFRLTQPRSKVVEWIQKTNFPLPAHLPHGYMHTDQLTSVLADGAAFKEFHEANITFPPTYKYDPGTQKFDTSSKQRTPAYTDRILYKWHTIRHNTQDVKPIECIMYDSVPSITTSDHKPVWGVFITHLRPGIDTVPLAAGLFNRDVYLEGIKRRARERMPSSTVCSLQ